MTTAEGGRATAEGGRATEPLKRVLIIGTGLIGTSIGMALAHSGTHEALLRDRDEHTQRAALARGAGRAWDGVEVVDLVIVCAPPPDIPGVLAAVQSLNIGKTYTHVSSVQSQVQREVEALGCDMSSVVGGHPLAGREVAGPANAAADLFFGRPWAICPQADTAPDATDAVRAVALACGGVPVVLEADRHDATVALLSHLPQVVASALAGLLPTDEDLGLSGPGLADTTRLAASDPRLWQQILDLNATHVGPPVRELARRLERLADDLEVLASPRTAPAAEVDDTGLALRRGAGEAVLAFLQRGNAGRANVPVKRGVRSGAFARVSVSVPDEPGQLAALLNAAAAIGVNVEDVDVDHLPGRPRGVIDLVVQLASATTLAESLAAAGWALVTVKHGPDSATRPSNLPPNQSLAEFDSPEPRKQI